MHLDLFNQILLNPRSNEFFPFIACEHTSWPLDLFLKVSSSLPTVHVMCHVQEIETAPVSQSLLVNVLSKSY